MSKRKYKFVKITSKLLRNKLRILLWNLTFERRSSNLKIKNIKHSRRNNKIVS